MVLRQVTNSHRLVALLALLLTQWENPPELFGTRDMIAFWAGTKVFLAGGNPYNSSAVLAQELLVMPMDEAQVFLNPPWALPLYSLFFWPSFSWARWLWFSVNIGIVGGSVLLCRKLFFSNLGSHNQRFAAVTHVTFLPSLMVFWMGQSTHVALFTLLLGLCLARSSRFFYAGLVLGCSLIKPQLSAIVVFWFFLVAPWKSKASLVSGVISGVLLLLSLSILINAQIVHHWLQADFSPLVFKTSTIATRVRSLIETYTGHAPAWPIYITWLCGMVVTAIVACRCGERDRFASAQFLVVLAVTLFFAPYAWFYDYAMLLPLHMVAIHSNMAASPLAWPRMGTIALNRIIPWAPQITVLFASFVTSDLGAHWWFPLAVVLPLRLGGSLPSTESLSDQSIEKFLNQAT
jgi:hypothetical protein